MQVETNAALLTLDRPVDEPRARSIQEITPEGLRETTGTGNVADTQRVFGEPLSQKDLRVWRTFLPRWYSLRYGQFEFYEFDKPTQEVIDQIQTAKSMQVFDDVQIWTPEGRYDDPMAVGVLATQSGNLMIPVYFPLVRWAESLPSFWRIKWMARGISILRTVRWLAFAGVFFGALTAACLGVLSLVSKI